VLHDVEKGMPVKLYILLYIYVFMVKLYIQFYIYVFMVKLYIQFLHIRIHSSFCVLNYILRTCRPNFTKVARAMPKV